MELLGVKHKVRLNLKYKMIRNITTLIVIIAWSILSLPASASEPEIIEKLVVTGSGLDADTARQNAIRNAVEQAIGTYVASETIAENHQLIKDKILTHSSGYVQQSRIIETEKKADGLVNVKLEALVVSTRLKQKIQALNIATRKVEGESLFGEAFSKIEQKKSGAEILAKIVSKYPQAAYLIEVGKPEIEGTDHNRNQAQVRIPLVIQWDAAFLGELKQVLSTVATKSFSSAKVESFINGSNRAIARNSKIVCIATTSSKRHGSAESCYALDGGLTGGGDTSLVNLPTNAERFSLRLEFKDRSGKNVETVVYGFTGANDYRNRQKNNKKEYSDYLYATLIEEIGEGFHPPNILWKDLRNSHLLLVDDGVFRTSVSIPVEVDKLKDVKSIAVSMNGFE